MAKKKTKNKKPEPFTKAEFISGALLTASVSYIKAFHRKEALVYVNRAKRFVDAAHMILGGAE